MVSTLLTLSSGIEWTWPPPILLLEVSREGSHGVHDHTPLDDIFMANLRFLIGKRVIHLHSTLLRKSERERGREREVERERERE